MARDRTDFADRIRPPAPKGAEITVARLEAELAAAQEAEANGPLARAKALREQQRRKAEPQARPANVVALTHVRP